MEKIRQISDVVCITPYHEILLLYRTRYSLISKYMDPLQKIILIDSLNILKHRNFSFHSGFAGSFYCTESFKRVNIDIICLRMCITTTF